MCVRAFVSVRAAWCGPGCGEALEIGDAEGLTSCFGIDSGGAQVLFSLLGAAGPSGQCRTESLATLGEGRVDDAE